MLYVVARVFWAVARALLQYVVARVVARALLCGCKVVQAG